MEPLVEIIYLPLSLLVGGIAACLLILATMFGLRRYRKTHHSGNPAEPNWSVPSLDNNATLNSQFHNWDPRLKIATLLVYCFMVVSLQSLPLCILALLVSIIAVTVSHLPWSQTLRRLKAMFGFLFMFLLVLPLTVPQRTGDILIVFGQFNDAALNMSGLLLAVKVVLKACAVAMMMDPLFATAPLSVTLNSLSGIGIPVVICQMILLSHRYIFVFLHEIKRMYKGMLVRGFQRKTNVETMKITGNFLGMLFVRSFDRTQRVYDAMLSRGYNGTFPSFDKFEARPVDWFKAGLWLTLGIVLLLLDKLVLAS